MSDDVQKLLLSKDADVPDEIRRIINNGFYTHHPFNRNCGLPSFMSIFDDIRSLPDEDFKHCVDAINRLLDRNSTCYGCYGKGLAYAKLLTEGISDCEYKSACVRYQAFVGPDDDDYPDGDDLPDYEGDILKSYPSQLNGISKT